jgi:hypothetical protein
MDLLKFLTEFLQHNFKLTFRKNHINNQFLLIIKICTTYPQVHYQTTHQMMNVNRDIIHIQIWNLLLAVKHSFHNKQVTITYSKYSWILLEIVNLSPYQLKNYIRLRVLHLMEMMKNHIAPLHLRIKVNLQDIEKLQLIILKRSRLHQWMISQVTSQVSFPILILIISKLYSLNKVL